MGRSTNDAVLETRPTFLRRLSTDEYSPMPYTDADARVLERCRTDVFSQAERRRMVPAALAGSRTATAAGLRALNEEWGAAFYDVPPEALDSLEVADEVFAGRLPVIDVQTHFMAPGVRSNMIDPIYRSIMPDWWIGLDGEVQRDLAAYMASVFLESETAAAVLSSAPGIGENRPLHNSEMAATRALVERLGGSGRLLNHTVVHADDPREVAQMEQWRDEYAPVGWKVYTMGHITPEGWSGGWMLNDEAHGLPFLERSRDLGVNLVCVHKGLSFLVDNGSPRDIGPAAAQFPELDFVVYHSGYEFPLDGMPEEGPYEPSGDPTGINRLIQTVHEAGVGVGGNVHAEIGSTWFSLIRRPQEAAHVLGKLIAQLGADNVVWGTDSCYYGSAQPIIDAFRSFQIPDEMCERYGYAPLTDAVKDKILSRNAAGLYGIDLGELAAKTADDDLAWARQIADDYHRSGFAWLQR